MFSMAEREVHLSLRLYKVTFATNHATTSTYSDANLKDISVSHCLEELSAPGPLSHFPLMEAAFLSPPHSLRSHSALDCQRGMIELLIDQMKVLLVSFQADGVSAKGGQIIYSYLGGAEAQVTKSQINPLSLLLHTGPL